MKNPHRKDLFPIQFYHGSVPDNDRLKELIIPLIEKTKDDNPDPTEWMTHKVKTSIFNCDLNNIIFGRSKIGDEVRDQYQQVWDSFFDGEFSIGLQETWYNYYTDGEYQEAHAHCGDWETPLHFSCVHYLSFDPKRHKGTTFNDPLEANKTICFDERLYDWKYTPTIKEGDFVMFPAYLSHEVKASPATPDYPRITLATNVRVMNYIPNIPPKYEDTSYADSPILHT